MTVSESISAGSIVRKGLRQPTRLLSFLLQIVWAVIVLTCVSVLWVILFVLFVPFIAVASLITRLSGNRTPTAARDAATVTSEIRDSELIFDRRNDTSKLFGCNTRNVQYRWQLFQRRLDGFTGQSSGLNALDFGAGSLRDSYELSKLGFKVVAVDLDKEILHRYFESYPWESSPATLYTGMLEDLVSQTGPNFFHLAIAFDVVEHLENPTDFCKQLHSLLHDQGLLFTIVPNGRSIFERYFRRSIKRQRKKGIAWKPGVPHLQFKTPQQWREFFEHNHFKVLEYDMTIGFLVNDCWHGLIGLPLRVYVGPVMAMLAHVLGRRFDAVGFERAFCPGWLMERVNILDQVLKKRLKDRFAWNLIIAQKAGTSTQTAAVGFEAP